MFGSIHQNLILFFFIITSTLFSDSLTIASWNIEHLGSPGRGFGYKSLPPRDNGDLRAIAELIEENSIELLAIQEAAITSVENGNALCRPLEKISAFLGEDWEYHINLPGDYTVQKNSYHNIHNAFLWKTGDVELREIVEIPVENIRIGRKRAFDRMPLAGYFATRAEGLGDDGNDFLLINLHLTSGQDNDENHLAAMVMLEQSIYSALKSYDITESDRIILGDFNDNPWAEDGRGRREYIDLMYRYMEEKGYRDLVDKDDSFTRISKNMDSIIDHVLINSSAARHMEKGSFHIYKPDADSVDEYQIWRENYSDHFPLIFELEVSRDDDAD